VNKDEHGGGTVYHFRTWEICYKKRKKENVNKLVSFLFSSFSLSLLFHTLLFVSVPKLEGTISNIVNCEWS
jgi:hypothetical protein